MSKCGFALIFLVVTVACLSAIAAEELYDQ